MGKYIAMKKKPSTRDNVISIIKGIYPIIIAIAVSIYLNSALAMWIIIGIFTVLHMLIIYNGQEKSNSGFGWFAIAAISLGVLTVAGWAS